MQGLALVLTYERVHYGDDADFNDTSSSEVDDDDIQDDGASTADASGHGELCLIAVLIAAKPVLLADYSYATAYQETLVINFKLRHTVHRIMNDKPVSIVTGEAPESSSTSDPSTLARLRRIHARIRQRRRDLGQSSGTAEADRLDEGSDEEREIGLPDGQVSSPRSSSSPHR